MSDGRAATMTRGSVEVMDWVQSSPANPQQTKPPGLAPEAITRIICEEAAHEYRICVLVSGVENLRKISQKINQGTFVASSLFHSTPTPFIQNVTFIH